MPFDDEGKRGMKDRGERLERKLSLFRMSVVAQKMRKEKRVPR